MRAVFRRTVPDVALLDGTAEEIPLPDGCADAVVSAQAFHWFRPGPTLRELRRVLRPRGGVGLVWNTRDGRSWSGRLSELLQRHGYRSRGRTEGNTPWERAFASASSGFTRVRYRAFPHAQWGPPSLFVERALSVSYIANLAPARQREVAREVRKLIASDPETRGRSRIRLPMRTEVYWSRRR
jgi:SAM-dependent methyltransferase